MRESPELYPVILRTLVGSHAHGVADQDSDRDYREVFVIPTSHLLQVPRSARPKMAWQSESRHTDDEGGWEVENFLEMCMRGHPNALELLWAPMVEGGITPLGLELRELAPSLMSRQAVASSFLGYAKNASHKMLDKETIARNPKWAATYLRVMAIGLHLLRTGILPVNLADAEDGVLDMVKQARAGWLRAGDVIKITDPWEAEILAYRNYRPGHKMQGDELIRHRPTPLAEAPNLEVVNDWLFQLRKDNWNA